MNLIKQLQFDFRYGLTRWQYLLSIPIFLLSCLLSVTEIESYKHSFSTLDFFFCSFAGSFPVFSDKVEQELQIPSIWFLIINGCIYINLGYVVSELSASGIQRIIRCRQRGLWFFSKCIWIIASCFIYFVSAFVMILLVQLLMYGEITFKPSIPILNHLVKGITIHKSAITISSGILIGIILPAITLITYSILELVLILYTKPIISFVLGIALQVVALCYQSAFIVGNGAMVIRNSTLVSNGVDSGELVATMIGIDVFLLMIGYYRFSQMDILEIGE